MKRVCLSGELRDVLEVCRRAGKRIGLVPTMGCLHEGHLSLIRRAKDLADVVVVTIFVNPLQFGPGEDFERYPRDLERDAESCEGAGADVLFHPSVAAMYAGRRTVFVDENDLSAGLCGARRPGHFRGVLTVVAKLFNLVQPDVAVFGEKDAQQGRLIEQMVKDLDFPIRIVMAPTRREADGLAMSSRNRYLSADERRRAPALYAALSAAAGAWREGERDPQRLQALVRGKLEGVGFVVEYVEAVDYDTLRPADGAARDVLVAAAARLGTTRLIDNIRLGCGGEAGRRDRPKPP